MVIAHRSLAALLLFAGLQVPIQPANADLLDRVRAGEPITVGFTNLPPWGYVDDQGRLTGLGPEVLRHVIGQIGPAELDGRILDFGALISGVLSHRIDMTADVMFVRPDRCDRVAFTEPTMRSSIVFIVPEGNPLGITTYTHFFDHPEARVAATAGTAEGDLAREVGLPDRQIALFPQATDAILAVRTGRVYALAELGLAARYYLSQMPPDHGLEITAPILEVAGRSVSGHAAMVVHPDETRFLEAVNAELERFVGTPEHLALVRPFGVNEDAMPVLSTDELCAGVEPTDP